jgi:hypothetical protein
MIDLDDVRFGVRCIIATNFIIDKFDMSPMSRLSTASTTVSVEVYSLPSTFKLSACGRQCNWFPCAGIFDIYPCMRISKLEFGYVIDGAALYQRAIVCLFSHKLSNHSSFLGKTVLHSLHGCVRSKKEARLQEFVLFCLHDTHLVFFYAHDRRGECSHRISFGASLFLFDAGIFYRNTVLCICLMLGWVGLGAEDVLVFALFFLFIFPVTIPFVFLARYSREANVEGRRQEEHQRRCCSCHSQARGPILETRVIPGELQDTRPSDIACRGLAPHRPGGAGPCTRPHPIYVPGRWDFLFSPGRSASLAVRILVGRGEIVFA